MVSESTEDILVFYMFSFKESVHFLKLLIIRRRDTGWVDIVAKRQEEVELILSCELIYWVKCFISFLHFHNVTEVSNEEEVHLLFFQKVGTKDKKRENKDFHYYKYLKYGYILKKYSDES